MPAGNAACRASARGVAVGLASLLLLALVGCASPPRVDRAGAGDIIELDGFRYRIERVPRGTTPLREVAPGWLSHPERGLLALHAETPDAYLVRVALALDDQALMPAPPTAVAAAPLATATLQPEGHFAEVDSDLPRRGEWRQQFALTPSGVAGARLIAPPARKTLMPPAVWARDMTGRWTREPAEFPAQNYDYGGVALGDFNADGRADIGLGMHLLGFAALFSDASGGWRDASEGLPHSRRATDITGSGVGITSLIDPAGDRLLLLPEFDGRRSRLGIELGLAEFRWRDGRWIGKGLSPGLYGSGLALSSPPGCAPLLAVKSSSSNQLPLLRKIDGRWQSVPTPSAPAGLWLVSALVLKQLDGERCADLLVAMRQRGGSGWLSTLALWTDSPDGWKAHALPRLPASFTLSALWVDRRADTLNVVAGSAEGDLLYLRGELGDVRWVGHLPAPAWRRGCGVAQIAAIPGHPHRWVVAFAGDGDRFDPQRCSSNGGLVEVAWEPAATP